MFNSNLKKEWLGKLENAQEEYKEEINNTKDSAISLFNTRKEAALEIKQVEYFINSIANVPKKYTVKLAQTQLCLEEFNEVASLRTEAELAQKISGGVAGAGAAAGVGIAALGPTAAMAIATTFGTASTGTAIASLSGAAATNAALAWLGGGALAAGGGGMTAGSSLLALAGPLGWAIGGAALVGSALFASSKNKKIAQEAEAQVYKIRGAINGVKKTRTEILATERLTGKHSSGIHSQLDRVSRMVENAVPRKGLFALLGDFIKRLFGVRSAEIVPIAEPGRPLSYSYFSGDLKKELGALVNNTLSLSQLVEKKIQA